jgi:hypothetical protein
MRGAALEQVIATTICFFLSGDPHPSYWLWSMAITLNNGDFMGICLEAKLRAALL